MTRDMSTLEVRPERPDRRSALPRPWRRHQVAVDLAPLLAEFQSRHRRADTALIERAFDVARHAHADQVRHSGEPYLEHPLGVAMVLAQLGLDDVTVAGALLHDSVEDTAVTVADIEAGFGPELAAIVDGVTKLDRLQFDSREAQQAATLRKMLVAMASDIRVLLIKLADRLHNMRTIASLPEGKQRRIAQETLDIYAPARAPAGHPGAEVAARGPGLRGVAPEALRRDRADGRQPGAGPPGGAGPAAVPAAGPPRRAARRRGGAGPPEARLVGVREDGREGQGVRRRPGPRRRARAIVDSVKDCYGALGSIHALWAPVQGRFKDYIAMPKFNLYQSLHTTVVGPGGKPVEVQIRTKEMHRRAEFGIAAHWGYKERSPAADLAWLQRMVDWQHDTADPTEFMETLKIDLHEDEVFVFTPKGKVVTLPSRDAGRLAYAIHTEVGHRCIGARVNGRLVPLDSALTSGDAVEIFTSKVEGAGPSLDWLQFVHTPRAASKIRQWFSRERRVNAIDTGREELSKRFRKEGLPVQKITQSDALKAVASVLHYHDLDALHAAVGERHVSARAVAQRVDRGAARRRGAAAGHHDATAARARSGRVSAGRGARRGPRRRHGPPVSMLHPGARRRDHGVRDPRPWRVGPPDRLRERHGAREPDAARHRRRVGPRRHRHVRRVGRGRGTGPLEAPARRRASPRRAPRQHPEQHVADLERPGRAPALRLRARRPEPPRLDPADRAAGRLGVRG